jgi:uncharacterized membrane protein
MNKTKLVALAITFISSAAMAQNIDIGAAATSALLTLAIRGLIAFAIFKLITINLTRKTLHSRANNGRYVGAWLMGLSILTFPSSHKSDADFYFGIVIVSISWFVLGFVLGYVWRTFKPLKEALAQQNMAEVTDEKLWERASVELNSDARNVGLWAKSFAEANGDEAKAKAIYLKETVKKLSSNIADSYKDKKITDNSKPNASEQAENEGFIIKMGRILLPLLVIFMVLVLLIF